MIRTYRDTGRVEAVQFDGINIEEIAAFFDVKNPVLRGDSLYGDGHPGDEPHEIVKVGCWVIKEIDTGHGAICTDDEFNYAFELVEKPCVRKSQWADKPDSTKERRFGYQLCKKHGQEYLEYCCLCAVEPCVSVP